MMKDRKIRVFKEMVRSNIVSGSRPLTSPADRVALLKAGFTGAVIEELYVKINGFERTTVSWMD